jgi:5-methylcytosine-specific restriction endonuclease McrA
MSNPDSKKNQQKRVSNYGKQYRKSHQDSISQYKKNWYRKRYDSDPEFRRRFLAAVNRRRAARVSATINPQSITIFIEGVKSKQFATCYYCKRRISTKRIHIDHILALSKGGSHSVENLCVSCPECNWSKNDRLLKDFVTLGQQLLEL